MPLPDSAIPLDQHPFPSDHLGLLPHEELFAWQSYYLLLRTNELARVFDALPTGSEPLARACNDVADVRTT